MEYSRVVTLPSTTSTITRLTSVSETGTGTFVCVWPSTFTFVSNIIQITFKMKMLNKKKKVGRDGKSSPKSLCFLEDETLEPPIKLRLIHQENNKISWSNEVKRSWPNHREDHEEKCEWTGLLKSFGGSVNLGLKQALIWGQFAQKKDSRTFPPSLHSSFSSTHFFVQIDPR